MVKGAKGKNSKVRLQELRFFRIKQKKLRVYSSLGLVLTQNIMTNFFHVF